MLHNDVYNDWCRVCRLVWNGPKLALFAMNHICSGQTLLHSTLHGRNLKLKHWAHILRPSKKHLRFPCGTLNNQGGPVIYPPRFKFEIWPDLECWHLKQRAKVQQVSRRNASFHWNQVYNPRNCTAASCKKIAMTMTVGKAMTSNYALYVVKPSRTLILQGKKILGVFICRNEWRLLG